VHSLPASELSAGPRRGSDEDKGLRLACLSLIRSYPWAGRRGQPRREELIMTRNKAQKAAVRQRMAETGEPYSVARRALQPGTPDPGEPGPDGVATAAAPEAAGSGWTALTPEEQYAREAAAAGVSPAQFEADLAAYRTQEQADQVQRAAGEARERADRARERADQAEEAAAEVEERAELAQAAADLALEWADPPEQERAQELADQAQTAADQARERADQAEEAAGDAEEHADDLEEHADDYADHRDDADNLARRPGRQGWWGRLARAVTVPGPPPFLPPVPPQPPVPPWPVTEAAPPPPPPPPAAPPIPPRPPR
jgi:hypothetical protein